MGARGQMQVAFNFTIEELSGIPLADGTKMKARWQRGQSVGEIPWAVVQGGVVQWKAPCHIPRLMMPTGEESGKKFLHISFFSDRQETQAASVKVPLQFHNDRKRRASLQFYLNKSDNRVKLQLVLTMQMRIISDSVGSDSGLSQSHSSMTHLTAATALSNSHSVSTRATTQNNVTISTPTSPFDQTDRDTPWGYPSQVSSGIHAPGSQISSSGTSHNQDLAMNEMKQNILKLYGKLQEAESRLSSKKRELNDVKSNYSHLKGEFDNLKTDYDSAEIKCIRLQNDLMREQQVSSELHNLKAQIQELERYEGHDPSGRGCDAGCVIS